MTFTQMSPANKNAIYPLQKGIQNERGINPTRTHYPHHPDIGGVLESGNTCSVCPGVTAPVAKKA